MNKFLDMLQNITSIGLSYGVLVNQAVKGVEAEVAGTNIDGATKKEMALTYVLAAAHAGETVPIGSVQIISALIDTSVSVLNALGVFKAKVKTP